MSSRLVQRLEDAAENVRNAQLKQLLSEAAGEIEDLRDKCEQLEDDLIKAEESLEDARRGHE